jgi:hypothetical protein
MSGLTRVLKSACNFLVLVTVISCSSSCKRAGSPPFVARYGLAKGGYSARTGELILDIVLKEPGFVKGRSLAVYSEATDSISLLVYPAGERTNDFAWIPGHPAFVVTYTGGMILFRDNLPGGGYRGTAIRCPVEIDYGFCSPSPGGEWLGVTCFSPTERVGYKLGLLDLNKERFMLTDIVADYPGLVWKNDTTLYVASGDHIAEVRLDSGIPSVENTVPITDEMTGFYGVFDGQPLLYNGNELRLGERQLLRRDSAEGFSAIATETFIFVSASPSLIVFDKEGRQVCRENPGREIRLGSVTEDPNAVYGIADGAVLVRISISKGRPHIETVRDLTE